MHNPWTVFQNGGARHKLEVMNIQKLMKTITLNELKQQFILDYFRKSNLSYFLVKTLGNKFTTTASSFFYGLERQCFLILAILIVRILSTIISVFSTSAIYAYTRISHCNWRWFIWYKNRWFSFSNSENMV